MDIFWGQELKIAIIFKIDDELILGDGVQFVDEDFEKISGEYVSRITIRGEKVQKAERNDIVSIGKLPEGTKYIYKKLFQGNK